MSKKSRVPKRDENLDRTCVNHSLFSTKTLSNGVFGYNSLSCTGVCRDKHALVALYGIDGNFLERIQLKLVFPIRFCRWNMLGYWSIVVTGWYSDLVPNLEHHLLR